MQDQRLNKKPVTGGIDFYDEIEYSESENSKMYVCVEKIEPVKDIVLFSGRQKLRADKKRNVTGNPES